MANEPREGWHRSEAMCNHLGMDAGPGPYARINYIRKTFGLDDHETERLRERRVEAARCETDPSQLQNAVAVLEAELRNRRKLFRSIVSVVALCGLVLKSTGGLGTYSAVWSDPVLASAFIFTMAFGGGWLTNYYRGIPALEVDLAIVRERARVHAAFPDCHKDGDYFDSLVRINVENLGAYYLLIKVHTDKSFWVSLAVGLVGVMLVFLGLAWAFVGRQEQKVAEIATAAGIITEVISGVFFYLYNRTVRQLRGYHDSLLAVQNVLLAFKLVGDTKDETQRAHMVSQMLTFLVSKQSSFPGAAGAAKDAVI